MHVTRIRQGVRLLARACVGESFLDLQHGYLGLDLQQMLPHRLGRAQEVVHLLQIRLGLQVPLSITVLLLRLRDCDLFLGLRFPSRDDLLPGDGLPAASDIPSADLHVPSPSSLLHFFHSFGFK